MSGPTASVPRMIFSPLVRLLKLLRLPIPTTFAGASPSALFGVLYHQFLEACRRLDLSLDPRRTLRKVSKHEFTVYNSALYVLMFVLAIFALSIIPSPLLRFGLPIIYAVALLLPLTSQFVFPATPIFSWLLTFFTARYIPSEWRPSIHVVLLPTLESVLYGANISDILTRYTHPALDVLAWLPYGVLHFTIPFVLAALLWIFAPRGAVQFFAKAFGVLNLAGVLCQLVVPCAAPWYEIIHGLTPADYGMPGSPGGLMRIDRVFGGSGYTNAFGNAPLVFGAFPSLHAGTSTMEALFFTHFFPRHKYFYWAYVGTLYWATMYLTHHYLIDVVGGGCLALACFFYFMPKQFKDLDTGIDWEGNNKAEEYELAEGRDLDEDEDGLGQDDVESGGGAHADDVDIDAEIRKLEGAGSQASSASATSRPNGPARKSSLSTGGAAAASSPGQAPASSSSSRPNRSVSWGATEVLGETKEEAT